MQRTAPHERVQAYRANMHMCRYSDTSNQSVFLLGRGRLLVPFRLLGFASSSTPRSTFLKSCGEAIAGEALRDIFRETGSDTILAAGPRGRCGEWPTPSDGGGGGLKKSEMRPTMPVPFCGAATGGRSLTTRLPRRDPNVSGSSSGPKPSTRGIRGAKRPSSFPRSRSREEDPKPESLKLVGMRPNSRPSPAEPPGGRRCLPAASVRLSDVNPPLRPESPLPSESIDARGRIPPVLALARALRRLLG